MDINGIGRFAFGVCKDIDNDRILDIMKVVASNIYIFPALLDIVEKIDLTMDVN